MRDPLTERAVEQMVLGVSTQIPHYAFHIRMVELATRCHPIVELTGCRPSTRR